MEDDRMLFRQHERWVEELSVQLQLEGPTTASGSILTLPAATLDLQDWMGDQRAFLPMQYDDWQQVIGDYRDSVANSGPKIRALTAPHTAAIDALLPKLMSSSLAADGNRSYSMDAAVRADISVNMQKMDTTLSSDAAIIAAWRDLVSSCERLHRTVEEVSHRRDTLWAIAERRGLDLGRFGVFRDVCAVLTDDATAVRSEQDRAAGVEPEFRMPNWEPSGLETWQRLPLCEQVLTREALRADCVVWLRLAPTHLPQYEVTHGQVTFYNASYLSGHIGHPELPHHFQVAPVEVLTPPDAPPLVPPSEVEWEDNWNMAYARVVLPDTEVHRAEAKARTLVEALKAVNHAAPGTWELMKGCILFINGRRSRFSWGLKEDVEDPYYPQNDWMGRDIDRMSRSASRLDSQSIDTLEEAIGLSTALKAASDESPQATVMAAVRAIEHVNAWTTRGVKNWADFVSDYFKKAQSRVRVTEFIARFTQHALHDRPDNRPGAPHNPELARLNSTLFKPDHYGHTTFHVRGAADHVATLKAIYADHWLARGLTELDGFLATPATMHARLEEHGRRFDRHLRRLKRLRNSAIHGGPVSQTACQSVEVFAYNLGHQCLNEEMRALLTSRDICSHMDGYRADHIDRYERVRTTGDIDALFVESEQ